jgi:pimeloyl-ACP methyl ester carboxylesterase
MGGMIARALVSAQPHRFASLTLIASHAGGLRHMVPTRVGLTNFARAQTAPPAERMLALERLLFPTEWVQSIDRDALRDRLLTRTKWVPRATILTQLQAMIRYGCRPETGAFRVSTLVLKPSDDVLVPPHNSDLLTQRIAGSRLVTIAGAGHGATFSHATQLNAALREHFDAHPVT